MDNFALPENGSTGERVGQSFLWMTWSGVISIANSVLVWVFMAQMRPVDEVGRFAVVMGMYALFFSVVSLGLMPYLINEISRRIAVSAKAEHSAGGFIGASSVLLSASGFATALIMTACGFLVSNSTEVHLSAAALSQALIPTGLIALAEAVAISRGRTRQVAVITTIENVLRTLIPLTLIWAGFDLFSICLSFALVRFAALLAYAIVDRSVVIGLTFSKGEFRQLVSAAVTFAATITFASLNWQAALILLGYLGTESEAANFGAASRFLIPVTILMASYASVIQPALARQMQKAPDDIGRYLARRARLPLAVAIIASIASPFLSRPILALLFGEAYSGAGPVLDILTLSTIPFCLVIIVARGLVALKRQRVDLIANILGGVICICAAAVAIPRYGAVGAAAAQLLSFISMAAIEVVYLSRKINFLRIWRPASMATDLTTVDSSLEKAPF